MARRNMVEGAVISKDARASGIANDFISAIAKHRHWTREREDLVAAYMLHNDKGGRLDVRPVAPRARPGPRNSFVIPAKASRASFTDS